ncbi:MAG: hypothetical protein JXD21_03990 [Candidatus Omnitrophica bacterium]|nr:hypothetical protein [Candidatus Omnitrophota bacterium]
MDKKRYIFIAIILLLIARYSFAQTELSDYSPDFSGGALPSKILDDFYSQSYSSSQSASSPIPSFSSTHSSSTRETSTYFFNPIIIPSRSYPEPDPRDIAAAKRSKILHYYNPNFVGVQGINMFEQQATVNPYSSSGQTSVTIPSGAYESPQDLIRPW